MILAIITLFVLVAILAAVVLGVVVFGARRFGQIEQRQAEIERRLDAIEHGDWTNEETDLITKSAQKAQPMRPLIALLFLSLLAPISAAAPQPELTTLVRSIHFEPDEDGQFRRALLLDEILITDPVTQTVRRTGIYIEPRTVITDETHPAVFSAIRTLTNATAATARNTAKRSERAARAPEVRE